MKVILSALIDPVKSKVDQYSLAQSLWKKLCDPYSKKHVGQHENVNDDCDSDEEEEAVVDMERELISALCDLNKSRK